jgi:hypothetical protein
MKRDRVAIHLAGTLPVAVRIPNSSAGIAQPGNSCAAPSVNSKMMCVKCGAWCDRSTQRSDLPEWSQIARKSGQAGRVRASPPLFLR